MIRILLADDRVLFRQGLASLLSLESDLNIVAEANNGQEAIALSGKFQPDIILMDVRMPICNGVEATNVIHQRYPWIRILVLTTFDEDEYVLHSLQAGALGYILKSTPSPQIDCYGNSQPTSRILSTRPDYCTQSLQSTQTPCN